MHYQYKGNELEIIEFDEHIFTRSDSVTAAFTLDCAAAHEAGTCADLPYRDYHALGAVTLSPQSFQAGPAALPTAQGDVEVARFYFSTNSGGEIVNWDIDLFLDHPTGLINVDTDNVGGGIDSAAAQGGGASLFDNPGVWMIEFSDPVDYTVTIVNWTSGQTLVAPVFFTHAESYRIFRPAQAASDGLALLAEAGDGTVLLEEAGDAVTYSVTAATSVAPGEKLTITIKGFPGQDFISAAAMLIPTNDTFIALNHIRLPVAGTVVKQLSAYDAGTEENSQSCEHIPGPYCGGEGYSPSTGEGFVSIGNGLHGTGGADGDGFQIVDARKFDWNNPVARVAITRSR